MDSSASMFEQLHFQFKGCLDCNNSASLVLVLTGYQLNDTSGFMVGENRANFVLVLTGYLFMTCQVVWYARTVPVVSLL